MESNHKRKRDASATASNSIGSAFVGKNVNSSNNNSNNNRHTKKKKKRLSKEELHTEEAEAKYSKLVHVSAKAIRKESKLCKAFECQKIVRKIKALKSSSGDSGAGEGVGNDNYDDKETTAAASNLHAADSKVERKIKNLEEKLRLTRAFDLEELVNTCLTRLGLDCTKASQKGGDKIGGAGAKKKANKMENGIDDEKRRQSTTEEEINSNEKATNENRQYYTTLIESMLRHKKMLAAIESVNASVSEYNRWVTRREEWLYHNSSKGKDKKKSKDRMNDNYASTLGGDSGLFINSLAGKDTYPGDGDESDDERGDNEEYKDYDYDDYVDVAPKKNRMGQRARKARAMALEAKREGKPYDLSSTKKWWEMKRKNPKKENETIRELASGLDASKQVAVAEVAEMGSSWKEEGKAHPSWAARQVQKAKSGSDIGSIEFKGKKITFD